LTENKHLIELAKLAKSLASLDLENPMDRLKGVIQIQNMAILAKVGLAQEESDEHECEFDGDVDCDICPSCGEHTGFCKECGISECCG